VRILILGGTRFLTSELARLAVEAGHDVVCASRGQSGSAPLGARFVEIDREAPDAYDPLGELEFDAVVDPVTRPSWARAAVTALGGRAGHWTHISSCSAYADDSVPGQRADAAVHDPAPVDCDESDMELYGSLKVASEDAVRGPLGDHALIIRPGLVVGPHDRSGRFTYWPERLADGGEVLAPGAPDDLLQMIDVRDLAAWLLQLIEARTVGVFDANSQPITRAAFLAAVGQGVGTDPTLTWVDQRFLAEQNVEAWMGPRSLPLWLPLPEYAGFMTRDVSDSLAAGLVIRPVADTARETLAWLRTDPDHPTTGLTRAEEAEVLAAWHARTAG
jgi:2'-hydroxyisoflavone reductase